MKYLYRIYQLLIALPLIAIYTLITSLMVTIGCTLGNGHFWGYYPGKWWAQFIIRILLLPVKVEGRENLVKGQSYVFVANHQGAFDIFLIYGFLSRNFKWMMKRQLRQMPFVGKACESAHHIFVDKRGASKIRETYDRARQTLQGGMSLVVFPEGARSFTGHMGVFKRGAFMLADDIELPVVPLTINGSFDIMPRTRDMKWVVWHPLRLTIHKPILPVGKGTDNIKYLEEESYKVVMSGLEEQYQGFVENPDQ
ncbi:lysophospholipid acyltransferase family protein [Leyella stercorea]|jgi:1-acyl-sn-glycerol-3-phosphate acyltransferase|uniref:lysophospholipid acyltransferase family protein n=1 Tax=Leyella stercorea TaxID=363265 RepID=UPI001E0990AD|nr:1-acyl-sn-glycerol-3-phosphate acyltransferase [Leyella stercorea]MBD8938138.1 1-acyl-sn-glycerol-3-phosphate acyltransferase [Leyella stercorea]